MSRAMTMTELGDLLKHIAAEHSPFQNKTGGRVIKYVHPNIDMRDFKCFSITLRGYGTETLFHTQNECRDLPQSLYERVMLWLDNREEEVHDAIE